jgi:hypothetical protein
MRPCGAISARRNPKRKSRQAVEKRISQAAPSLLFLPEITKLGESRRFPCSMLRAAITTTYINCALDAASGQRLRVPQKHNQIERSREGPTITLTPRSLGSLSQWATGGKNEYLDSCALEKVSAHQLSLYSKILPKYVNDKKPGFNPLSETIDVKSGASEPIESLSDTYRQA